MTSDMAIQSRRSRRSLSRRVARASQRGLSYVIAIVAGAAFMTPFVWTLFSSFKDYTEVYKYPPTLLPKIWRWENYPFAWNLHPMGRWMINSVVVTTLSLVGTLLSSCLVAYSFAKFKYPGQSLLFWITLSTMMLPASITLIPQYLLFHKLKWLNTHLPLIVPSYFGGGAFNIFLLRQFFLTLPNDLSEAATIDGANSFKILYAIILPLSKPALATVAVIFILWSWDRFIEPLIYLNSPEKFTMAVGLKYFERAGPGAYTTTAGMPIEHLLMAASVMMTAPIVVLFFLAQRYFVQGVVMSGIKG